MISVWPLSDQVFCCTANWFLCPLGYLLCDRWLQVAVTLCCHLSPRSLGRKEPAVRSPPRLPVAPRLLWQTPKLLWTRYLPPAGGPPRCALWTAARPHSCRAGGVNPGLWGTHREVWQLHKLWLSCETTPGFTGHLLSRAPGNEMSENWVTEMIAGEGSVLRHWLWCLTALSNGALHPNRKGNVYVARVK